MSAARDFKGDYSPGGLAGASKRRTLARRAGIASGVKRRQLSTVQRQPRCRSRQQALRLAYSHRQVTREQFEALYRRARPNGNEGGLETAWLYYASLFKRYRVGGQHYRTTNGQRGAALASDQRTRCRRTVQRLNRLMGEMGLATVSHRKDQRATPGHKDCLIVEISSPSAKKCHPPSGSRNRTTSGVPACSRGDQSEHNQSSPPPSAADVDRPASPAATEREELEAHLAFMQLKLSLGWESSTLRSRRAEVSARLRRGDCA